MILISLKATALDNAFYINISNIIARKKHLDVVANNTANTNTIGFEADSVLFTKFNIRESFSKTNAFVHDQATYSSENEGALQKTDRSLDLAIIDRNHYFKLKTPRGVRYSLNGSLLITADGTIVNSSGYPYLSIDNQVIIVPENIHDIAVSREGLITADGEEVGQIGVFIITEKYALIKEGNGLSISKIPDMVAENFTILSGMLRTSNADSTKSMTDLIELQRSFAMSTNMMSDISELSRTAVSKITIKQ